MADRLPIHPLTGEQALAILGGRPIWPIHGADGADDDGSDKGSDDGGTASGKKGSDTGSDGDGEADFKAEAAKWKALARKHENQAKENADAARRLKELDDADKSEVDKAKERASAAEKKAADAELRAMRLEIAADKGLPFAMAKRLVGSNREELEADAEELAAYSKKTEGNGEGVKRPPVKGRDGAVPSADNEDNDPTKLAAMVPRH